MPFLSRAKNTFPFMKREVKNLFLNNLSSRL
nr:MAG TPA: hypothetical protein [Caudoviricetes sp.]